jgi:hypothetical protein
MATRPELNAEVPARTMRTIALCALLVGCGWSRPTTVLSRPLTPAMNRAIASFVDATRGSDVSAIRALLGEHVDDGGLWFDDASCREDFAAPRAIDLQDLDRFAACLAAVPLERSARNSATPGVVVLESTRGIELEAAFHDRAGAVTLRWIGYAGKRGSNDVWPTISGEALEVLRDDGARPITQIADMEEKTASWLKVCIDEAGNVQAIVPRWTTSPAALEAAMSLAQGWTFRRFVIADVPLAVCAMVSVAHPNGELVADLRLPSSVPGPLSDAIGISSRTIRERRIDKTPVVHPNDDEVRA